MWCLNSADVEEIFAVKKRLGPLRIPSELLKRLVGVRWSKADLIAILEDPLSKINCGVIMKKTKKKAKKKK